MVGDSRILPFLLSGMSFMYQKEYNLTGKGANYREAKGIYLGIIYME